MKASKIEKTILEKKFWAVKRQILNTPTQEVVVSIEEDEPLQLNISKEELALRIRDYIMEKFSLVLTFVDFDDDDWSLYFVVSEFDNMKNKAINHLLNETDNDSYFYIKKYNYLLVSEGGKIVGEISDVADWQILDAVKIVRCLSIRFNIVTDSYHSARSILFGNCCFLKKSDYNVYKEHLAYVGMN